MAIRTDPEQDEKRQFDRNFDHSGMMSGGAVGMGEIALGALALIAWFIIFAGGILIGTEPARLALSGSPGPVAWLRAFAVVLLFWTITNVGILSCIAAFLGAVGRRTRFTMQVIQDDCGDLAPTHLKTVAVYYLSAIMRGFGIYSLAFAGLLLLATEAFQDPEQGGYLRLAATLSVISFYAGYDPETFAGLLERVKKFFEGK